MAKTIEERANKKYNNPVEPYCFETDNEEQWYRCGLRDGYIEGAHDQRKIGIEKACKAYCKQCALIDKETLTSGFVACAQYIDRKNCPHLQDLIKQMEAG